MEMLKQKLQTAQDMNVDFREQLERFEGPNISNCFLDDFFWFKHFENLMSLKDSFT